jgi:hypothetical protein
MILTPRTSSSKVKLLHMNLCAYSLKRVVVIYNVRPIGKKSVINLFENCIIIKL